MALVLLDRVQQTGTANTTVSFTLTGSVAGYQSWSAVGNGNTSYYGASDASGNWEVGLATYSTTGPTVTRTTIFASSNSGSAVTFSGTVNVWVDYPAGKAVYIDANGNVSALGTIASGVWQGTTVGVAYGGTGITILTANYIPYGNGTGAYQSSSTFTFNGTTFSSPNINVTSSTVPANGEYLAASNSLAWSTNTTERMRIDSSGNVGIGTTTTAPANGKALTIYASDFPRLQMRNSTTGDTAGDGTVFYGSGSDFYIYNQEAGSLNFQTYGSTRATIDSSGNVLVGTTTAWAKLSVQSAGTTSATQVVSFRDSSANEKLVVRSDGYTYAPYWYANTTGNGANVFVDTNGGLVRSTSSLKYKKNIQDAIHGLDDVLKLRAVTYEGKSEADTGKTFGGLIAEEVYEAGLTEFVQYAEDGTPDALAYGNMVSLAFKAIQELKAIVDTQAEQIKALQGAK